MSYDVIVIGGSFAGQAAALQLARARRAVLLLDSGSPRNRFAIAAHGVLGHDGKAPAALMGEAARQLAAYPTAELLGGEAVQAQRAGSGFTVTLAGGAQKSAARLVLATGVRDELPAIEGLGERWGRTVLHCPYCHGYEHAEQQLGVLATHPLSAHQASLIPDWGPTTYFTQGTFEPDAEQAALFLRRGVAIVREPIVELLGAAPELQGVRLQGGRTVELGALFVATKTLPASPLAEQLGCGFEEGPTGPFLKVDAKQQTTVLGVYAAGDAATPMANATLASATGMTAGVCAHQSLVFDGPLRGN